MARTITDGGVAAACDRAGGGVAGEGVAVGDSGSAFSAVGLWQPANARASKTALIPISFIIYFR